MDKNAIKKYAVWARRELIERVSQRAMIYGITAKDAGDPNAESVNGHLLSQAEKRQRQALIRNIKEKGYEQVMEEVAYTWFNRFAALRFMEVNGYLPSHIRVFTNDTGEFKPQILAEAIHLELDGLDMNKVYELESANKSEELFKYLLIVQCNALNSILPGMFQRIEDYTELLLPDYLLREGSVIEQMVTTVPEEDWTDQVQIIGWLYQYYNTEPKDKVFADLKKNIKITKENIPAATQLFTPDWIVHYMVENSLGRLWLEGHPDEALQSTWKYYLPEAEQEPQVQAQLSEIRKEYANIKPEDIRCIDPCMGSGHILCYLFDVLVQIYEAYGYSTRDAAQSIVENNLYGLDIDDRAAQLAYFAVMMKARQYDRRFFTRGIQPHVMAIQESNTLEAFDHLQRQLSLDTLCLETANQLIRTFRDAKEYGSILNVEIPGLDHADRLMEQLRTINGNFELMAWIAEAEELLPVLAKQAAIMQQKYDVVVTNPPYMGLKNMSSKLFDHVMARFPLTKNDLYGVFIQMCSDVYCKNTGLVAMITQHVWMFTSGFEKYRHELYLKKRIESLVHLGTRAFEEISGEVVQTCAFVLTGMPVNGHVGTYIRLVNAEDAVEKEKLFLSGKCRYSVDTTRFSAVPGEPMCYWFSDSIFDIYRSERLVGDVSNTRQGLKTSDDKRFVRFFYEVDATKLAHGITSVEQAAICGKKWFWLNKGGQIKWYGNNVYVINWEDDGREVKEYATQVAGSYSKNITAIDAYFKRCISWPQISISHPSFRYIPDGYIFASAGPSLFANNSQTQWYIMGLLNSAVTQSILDAINPTINFGVSDILKVPFKYSETNRDAIDVLVNDCIAQTRREYDEYETSWDFQQHPLVGRGVSTVAEAYALWEGECNERFAKLKANEEELNRIFIDIYGLQDELTPEVEDKDVTVRRADLGRDIRSFISYAVGCMFGRYSLCVPGLLYAGGTWNAEAIRQQIWDGFGKHFAPHDPMGDYEDLMPDRDGILPICDDEYFTDDIVGKFVKFIEIVYGKETLEANLKFIAGALGGKGSPREVIRSYFLNGFYADHLKIYQKRPIYWLFDSGKKNGFKCLIYMHRYQPDTIARIRTDYVHEQQSRYRTAIADLEQRINGAATSERVKLSKQLAKLQAQAEEVRVYEEKIHHLADQMIKIDLDDGVKHNYEIFKDVLAKIK